MELEELLKAIQVAFRHGPPNGWLLGWPRERFGADLADAVSPHPIQNHTSFDYSFCNRYEIQIARDKSSYLLLAIRVSFISDCFCLHWTRYKQNGRKGNAVESLDSPDALQVEDSVRRVLVTKGLFEVPHDWLRQRVLEIQLELSEDEEVTVSKCLFEDY